MRRDVGIVQDVGSPAFVQALEDAVVALMIEKKQAVEDLDAILSVPGIDMVQFGPADYAMSIGLTGEWTHPRVREAERFTIETALRKGIAPRAEIADPDQARRYLDMGVRHFCIGWDVSILARWFTEAGGAMREILGRGAAAGDGARPAPRRAETAYPQGE
jgi:4-hydroxy-2-oxoheptanedioate aldolase